MIDLHAHILPQLDDGPVDWETSMEMCRIAWKDGIKKIIASPHIKDGVYYCDTETILNRVEKLNHKIKGILELEVLIGADVHFSSDLVDRVKRGEIPTINNKGYLLLELPFNSTPLNLEQIIFELRLIGIFPILTHPERNTVFQNNPHKISSLVYIGAYVQITAMSLTGGFGKKAMRCAEKLLASNLVHNIATDAHSPISRPPVLSPAVNKAKRIVGESAARMLVCDIPQKILQGEEINVSDLKKMV